MTTVHIKFCMLNMILFDSIAVQSLQENMTKMTIKSDQAGRIIGRKGIVVKAITKESGAQVRVISVGQPQVCILLMSSA